MPLYLWDWKSRVSQQVQSGAQALLQEGSQWAQCSRDIVPTMVLQLLPEFQLVTCCL